MRARNFGAIVSSGSVASLRRGSLRARSEPTDEADRKRKPLIGHANETFRQIFDAGTAAPCDRPGNLSIDREGSELPPFHRA